jgi:hypothetical protein
MAQREWSLQGRALYLEIEYAESGKKRENSTYMQEKYVN